MADAQQYATFCVAGQYFGLEVAKVQEIIRLHTITRVPLAPAVVRGLINIRGEIVTALDLRRRLGMPELPPERQSINVVVVTEDGPVSLLVDEIGDVRDVAGAAFESAPETLPEAARALIQRVYKLPERLLLILDIDRILMPDGGEAVPTGRAALQPPSQGAGQLEYVS